jgi:hypothetical protein
MTVEIKLRDDIKKMFEYVLDKIESLELLELLRIDYEKGEKLVLVAYTIKEGYNIKDIDFPENVENVTLIKKEGNKYICLTKASFLRKFTGEFNLNYDKLSNDFKLDVIWDTPTSFTEEKMVCTVIGDEENLKKFLEVIKFVGCVEKTSFKKAMYSECAVLSCLTDKQKEIIIVAKKNGYYKYPREINSEELAKKVGLSKPTVVQHLRKAEVRIMSNILTGY